MHVETRTRPETARRARRHPANRLLAALHDLGKGHATLLRQSERPWASITFAGAQHTFAFAFAGGEGVVAGEAFIAALSDHEFAIPGRLVAEANVTAVRQAVLPEPGIELECEILLLDED